MTQLFLRGRRGVVHFVNQAWNMCSTFLNRFLNRERALISILIRLTSLFSVLFPPSTSKLPSVNWTLNDTSNYGSSDITASVAVKHRQFPIFVAFIPFNQENPQKWHTYVQINFVFTGSSDFCRHAIKFSLSRLFSFAKWMDFACFHHCRALIKRRCFRLNRVN